jgi:hypothetical protein
MAKARKQFDQSLLYPDGYVLRIRVWEVPQPVPPSEHRFKYSLFYGCPGDREEDYDFKDVDTLIADFLADVRRARGEGE